MSDQSSIESRTRYLEGGILASLLIPLLLLQSIVTINYADRWRHQHEVLLPTDQPIHCALIPVCSGSGDHSSVIGRNTPFGRMVVESDVRRGPLRWYVYGLIREPEFGGLRGALAPYGVELVGGGCVIGEREYERNMAYNRAVWKRLPPGAQKLLATRYKRMGG